MFSFLILQTGTLDDLRKFVIKCLVLIYTEGREKLKTMLEATRNGMYTKLSSLYSNSERTPPS